MTQSLTPAIETVDNSTNTTVIYTFPSKTQSQSPPIANVKATTNLTITHQP